MQVVKHTVDSDRQAPPHANQGIRPSPPHNANRAIRPDKHRCSHSKRYDPYDSWPASVWTIQRSSMLQLRTHYEQVPLEIVRKIVEQQIRRDSTIEQDQGTRKKALEEDLIGEQQQTLASSDAFSEREC